MFGRLTRTLIPAISELLKSKIVENVQGKLLNKKQLQAKHYKISAKKLTQPPPYPQPPPPLPPSALN